MMPEFRVCDGKLRISLGATDKFEPVVHIIRLKPEPVRIKHFPNNAFEMEFKTDSVEITYADSANEF